MGVSIDLFSRAVSSQVFSAQTSLTAVFGMGTGGPSLLKTLTRDVITPLFTSLLLKVNKRLLIVEVVQALGLLVSVS